jgi:carboxypeptidase C (cathepsin A)
MKKPSLTILLSIFVCAWNLSQAQSVKETPAIAAQDSLVNLKKPQKSITYSTVTVAGNPIHYKAIAGTIILKNTMDTPTASIFYTAYFKEGEKEPANRALTFLYNGGPGSSSK